MLVVRRADGSRVEQFETAESLMARECRRISLRGPIIGSPMRADYLGPTQICESILAYNYLDRKAPIWLFIESGGGDIDTAFALYDTIRMSKAPVYTVGQACASAATLLLAAGVKRFLYQHARVMLHLPSGVAQGDVREIAIRTQEFERVRDALVDAYIECGVKKTRAEILNDIDREMWLTPVEAIGYGLADEIITSGALFDDCLGMRPLLPAEPPPASSDLREDAP